MSLDFAFGESVEVDKYNLAVVDAWRSEDAVGVVVGEGDQVVYLIFLEFEGFDDVLDLHREEVDQEGFVVQRHHDLVLTDPHLLYLGVECQVGNYLLGL